MEWFITNNNQNVIVAHRPSNWTGSWGEQITIVKLDGYLLLNSICDPEKPASITSFGWNKRNLKSFVNNLIAVQKGEPWTNPNIELENESEWTFKKILMRVVAYPLSLFFVALFCYMLHLHMNALSRIVTIIPAALAVVWMRADILMILGKGKTNAQQGV